MREEQGSYLGRYQLGQRVNLTLWCRTPSGTPAIPDASPVVRILGPSSVHLKSFPMPIADKFGATGLFIAKLYLTSSYTLGHYAVNYSYSVGGQTITTRDMLEVIDGGDGSGTLIALGCFTHPEASYALGHLNSRRIVQGRNPHL